MSRADALDRYRAIIRDQQRKVERLIRSSGVAPVRRSFDDMLTQLERALARMPGTFNETILRGMMAQVKLHLSRFVGAGATELGAASQIVSVEAARSAFEELARMERLLADAVVPLPLNEIARLKSLTPTTSSALRLHARSFSRYGAHLVGVMEQELAAGLTIGENSSAVARRLMGVADLEWYRAERIVRTELSYSYNASHADAIAEESEALDGDVWMQWSEHVGDDGGPLDTRVAVDSLAMHGQVAPPGGLFTCPPSSPMPDAKGRTTVSPSLAGKTFSHPPNRPNDRAVLAPWRPHWGIPGWIWRGGERVRIREIPARRAA